MALGSGASAIRELGARVSTLFQSDMGMCSVSPAAKGTLLFEVGSPVPDGAFEPGQTIERGPGRILARHLAGSDGTPVMVEGTSTSLSPGGFAFRDPLRGVECRLLPLPDGRAACLPLRGSVFVYSDPECTQRALLVEPGQPVPRYSTEETYSPSPDCAALPLPLVWAVGAKVAENGFYERTGASCLQRRESSDPPRAYYALTPVPLTDFVIATAKTD